MQKQMGNSLRRPALIGIMAVHAVIYLAVEACAGYVIYAGLTKRQDRKTVIAAAAIVGESLVFFVNGRRCPLTRLAEDLGAAQGSVADIFLPGWLASRLFAIHVPLAVAATYLHARCAFARFSRSSIPLL